jgi:hypothetical protein
MDGPKTTLRKIQKARDEQLCDALQAMLATMRPFSKGERVQLLKACSAVHEALGPK